MAIKSPKIPFKLLLLWFFIPYTLVAQEVKKYAGEINENDLYQYLSVLVSDSLEGRGTGKIGQVRAANYIAHHFKNQGLTAPVHGSYFQRFNLADKKWGEVYLKINGKQLAFFKDFYCYGQMNIKEETKFKVVFAGFGIDDPLYSDYSNINVKGKVVVIFMGEPVDSAGISLLTKTKTLSAWAGDWKKKSRMATEKGAAQVFIVSVNSDEEFEKKVISLKHHLSKPKMTFASKTKMSDAAFFVSPSVAAQMLTIKTLDFLSLKKTLGYQKTGFKMKSAKLLVKAESIETPVQTENVLGYLEGTDLKDELVVVTAHYDHLGMQEEKIFRGADDDGTGVITVMSLAKAFSIAKKDGKGPRRSILFMTFTGEEHGLLGSEYYADFPVFPLANTVCDLNIDMTGRLDADHAKDSNYVYVIGSDKLSDELKQVNEQANTSCCGLKLDYKFDASDDPNKFYYRSDHYNFAKKNIPVIFYFNGVHEDYHQSTDTIDKIVFSKVHKIAQLVFTTTWNLANQPSRLKLNK